MSDPSIVLPAQDPTAFIGPKGIYPDPQRTPGAVNPDITQANIARNLCNPNWSTDSIRPPSSYTTALKIKQMTPWGLGGTTADYEEDHASVRVLLGLLGAPHLPTTRHGLARSRFPFLPSPDPLGF